ncbi:MAG: hypothetical protein KJZ80_03125 [Hyphomicrobiaceae bacterium]|nr:hypothetical protein [Hyphomicrobiaceae bacterium]
MSARIVELSRVAAARAAAVAQVDEAGLAEPSAEQFQFWAGASGERYVHSVFSLIGCPELPKAVYVLSRCDKRGRQTVLRVGRTEHEAPSLNLAEIRHRGAQLGANQVHVHFLAGSERKRRRVELDLRTAHFSELSAESSSSMRH